MKTTNCKNMILGTALLGIGLSVVNPALAAPRNDVRREQRDVKEARKEVKRERRDVRQADTAAERRREQRDVQRAREELREERRDVRQERREDYGYNRPGWNNQPRWGNQPNWNNPVYSRPGVGHIGGQLFTGTVTRVRSNQSFDINVGGNIYNVYLDTFMPRGLSNGDIVQVGGVRTDNNDIRNATARILNNR